MASFPGQPGWVSPLCRYQKGKSNLDLNEARDDGVFLIQWHQLDHMQTICTSLQTDNHTNTSSLNFYRLDALPDTKPTLSKCIRQNKSMVVGVNSRLLRCLLPGVQTLDVGQALFMPVGASLSLLIMFLFFDSLQLMFAVCTASRFTRPGFLTHTHDYRWPSEWIRSSRGRCSSTVTVCIIVSYAFLVKPVLLIIGAFFINKQGVHDNQSWKMFLMWAEPD